MAIYHLNVSTGSIGGGQSAGAKADYIEREGEYEKGKEEVAYVEHGNMPEWAQDNPNLYWQSADTYERANGRLYRQIEFALPVELSREEQIALAHDFAKTIVEDDLPYTLAIHKGEYDHRGKQTNTPENPHVHLIISERVNDGIVRSPKEWFKRANKKAPEQGGAYKTERLKSREYLLELRERWAVMANEALERAGHRERIDHRTLEAQGIDREPQKHRGVFARMEQRGIATDKGDKDREIKELKAEISQLERLKAMVEKAVQDNISREPKPSPREIAPISAEQAMLAYTEIAKVQDLNKKRELTINENTRTHQKLGAENVRSHDEIKELESKFLGHIRYGKRIKQLEAQIERNESKIAALKQQNQELTALSAEQSKYIAAAEKQLSALTQEACEKAPNLRLELEKSLGAREVAKIAGNAISGDFRRLFELEKALAKHGYKLNTAQILKSGETHPLAIKDAIIKHTSSMPQRQAERSRDDKLNRANKNGFSR